MESAFWSVALPVESMIIFEPDVGRNPSPNLVRTDREPATPLGKLAEVTIGNAVVGVDRKFLPAEADAAGGRRGQADAVGDAVADDPDDAELVANKGRP